MKDERSLNRRSFFHRVTGAAVTAGALVGGSQEASAVTDNDPTDRVNQGTGCEADRDPSDPARCGGRTGGSSQQVTGYVLLIAGVGAAAAGTYMRRKK